MTFLLRLLLRVVLNAGLMFALAVYLPQYISVTGGWQGLLMLGALITVLNVIARPVLGIITLPLKLFTSIVAAIAANLLFLWLIEKIVSYIDPALVTLDIYGGIVGWLVIAAVFGIAEWLIRTALKS